MTQPFSSSAAERNKGPIFERLMPLLGDDARVLEIGAGDGTHARYAVSCMNRIDWQSSEHPDRIKQLEYGLKDWTSLPKPLALDVTGLWPVEPSALFTVVYAANVAHIMAWPEVVKLFAGSVEVLEPGGLLCLYGPFYDDDIITASGNVAFDNRLRSRDSAMGLRRIQALDELAHRHDLSRFHDWSMPANNRLLVWQK